MLAMVCCNTVVIAKARRIQIRRSTFLSAQKLTIVAMAVMGVFVVSVLPYFIIKLVYLANKESVEVPMNPWFRRAVISSYYLMHVSSTVNPVIYVLQGYGHNYFRKIKTSLVYIDSPLRTVVGTFRRTNCTKKRRRSTQTSVANFVDLLPRSKITSGDKNPLQNRLRCVSREIISGSSAEIQMHSFRERHESPY